jgi:hypothetical protein
VEDPTQYLVRPEEPDSALTKGFVNPLDIFNYLSPSAWLNAAIAEVTGFDVIGWMSESVGGDWAAMYRFGDAVGNLGSCLRQLGTNVRQAAFDMDAHWSGNAADAALRYLFDLGGAVSGQQESLDEVKDRYQKAALGAFLLADELGNIAQAMADRAILMGISAAAGALASETGIGAAAGYGAAALIALDILNLVNRASFKINTFGGSIMGLFGLVLDAGQQGGDLSKVPLPRAGYDHPAV